MSHAPLVDARVWRLLLEVDVDRGGVRSLLLLQAVSSTMMGWCPDSRAKVVNSCQVNPDALGVGHWMEVHLFCSVELLIDDESDRAVGVVEQRQRCCGATCDMETFDHDIERHEAEPAAGVDLPV